MNHKTYEGIEEFEQQTSYSPLYLAWHVVDEARDYFRTPISEAFADELARRAEIVFANQPFWQRKFRYRRSQTVATNRAAILTAMRHWLAGILARENPVLFRQLPDSFKVGHSLPESPRKTTKRFARPAHSDGAVVPRFVHGCELMPI